MHEDIDSLKATIANQEAALKSLSEKLQKAEAHTKASDLLLANVMADLPEHIFWMDKEGRILGCNEKHAKTFGFSGSKELIGKNVFDVAEILGWDKSIAGKIRKNDLEILQTGKSNIIEEEIIIGGEQRTMFVHKKPLKDDTGNIIGVMGIASDITARKGLENDLIVAEEKASGDRKMLSIYLENILDSIPEHLYWMDKNNIMLGCNEQQVKNFGLSHRSQVIGKTIRELGQAIGWDETIIQTIYNNNQEIIESKTSKIIEESAIFNGEHRTFLSYKKPLLDQSNNAIGVLGVTVDITERKQMEEELLAAKERAEQASKAKSDFVMNMSHDIRTPLNGIVGMAQILEYQETDIMKKEFLKDILNSGQSLTNLLTEIIELANLDTFGVSIEENKFDLKEIISQIFTLLNSQAKHKNLDLNAVFPVDLPEILISDKLRIHRILLNLLGNALKFTSKGSVSVEIKIIEKRNDTLILEMAVIDTGIGMPNEKLENIFEKFSRLSRAESSPYKGNGLGLYIVRQFVEDLKGKITAKSEVGVGSQFICILPFQLDT